MLLFVSYVPQALHFLHTSVIDWLGSFLNGRSVNHKNNRLQWGAMSALNTIVLEDTAFIYNELPTILEAAERGTVITRDHAVEILIKLCTVKK